MRKDQRGFKIYSLFKDTYLSTVAIQQSSSIHKRCWIFVSNDGKDPRSNLVTDGSMHLSVAQAKRVIKALQKFIDD